ncbi:hypothetical protein BKA63DRAFT_318970 [Paraphoma chrysanthemicola]|nr:hypothetical protein BKA63DRAFT_318970 [Paraphoma chrysanthemicola]
MSIKLQGRRGSFNAGLICYAGAARLLVTLAAVGPHTTSSLDLRTYHRRGDLRWHQGAISYYALYKPTVEGYQYPPRGVTPTWYGLVNSANSLTTGSPKEPWFDSKCYTVCPDSTFFAFGPATHHTRPRGSHRHLALVFHFCTRKPCEKSIGFCLKCCTTIQLNYLT